MRILLDECVNPRVREAFPEHEVKTVRELGWGGINNGKLMSLGQRFGFDVFVTVDSRRRSLPDRAFGGMSRTACSVCRRTTAISSW
jgi:hypothetical protein